jgi:cysteine desulfurase/selenocysteine lyase
MAVSVLPDVAGQFPILSRPGLVYLDSAATAQTPVAVLDEMERIYRESNANIHRGVYPLAQEATDAFEGARRTVADWIGSSVEETIFTKNATEAINLVAYSWGVATSAPATACSSPRWSTTRTSCRGSSCARRWGRSCGTCP